MIRTSPRALPRLLAVLAAVLVAAPIAPAGARAEPKKPTLTWSVQPANERGPDGRRWIENTVDPGQVVTERLAVRNFSDRAAAFSLKAADGYLTGKGRFTMLPSHRASVDGGTWIKVREQVTVGANETKVVPFTITVPRDATPGDHPAGIAATITSTGGTVAVESRVGFRVMMRVSGTITAALAVDDLTATYRQSWNPFSAGVVRVRYTARNEGTVAAGGSGRVTAAGPFGVAARDTVSQLQETLPGGSRTVETRVGGVRAWGLMRATVEMTPAARAGATVRPTSATVTVWTMPWPQLVLVAVLGALVTAFRILQRRRRRRISALLDRARDEGRAEARQLVK